MYSETYISIYGYIYAAYMTHKFIFDTDHHFTKMGHKWQHLCDLNGHLWPINGIYKWFVNGAIHEFLLGIL